MASRPKDSSPFRTQTNVMRWLLALILVSPLIVYMSVFGLKISDDHTRWGEMGSALSGIYSPILAFLALLVVFGQLKSQNGFHEHEMDQRYIEQNREDINFYVQQLDQVLCLDGPSEGNIRQMLHGHFLFSNTELFSDPQLIQLAQKLNRQYPQLLGIWGAVYPIWIGLNSQNKVPYKLNALAALHKMIAVASFETCVALDHYHRTLSEDRFNLPYQFSPLLRDVA
jgi:hypothetical protein